MDDSDPREVSPMNIADGMERLRETSHRQIMSAEWTIETAEMFDVDTQIKQHLRKTVAGPGEIIYKENENEQGLGVDALVYYLVKYATDREPDTTFQKFIGSGYRARSRYSNNMEILEDVF